MLSGLHVCSLVARLYRWQLWSREAVATKAPMPPAPAQRLVTASVCAGQEWSAAGELQAAGSCFRDRKGTRWHPNMKRGPLTAWCMDIGDVMGQTVARGRSQPAGGAWILCLATNSYIFRRTRSSPPFHVAISPAVSDQLTC